MDTITHIAVDGRRKRVVYLCGKNPRGTSGVAKRNAHLFATCKRCLRMFAGDFSKDRGK